MFNVATVRAAFLLPELSGRRGDFVVWDIHFLFVCSVHTPECALWTLLESLARASAATCRRNPAIRLAPLTLRFDELPGPDNDPCDRVGPNSSPVSLAKKPTWPHSANALSWEIMRCGTCFFWGARSSQATSACGRESTTARQRRSQSLTSIGSSVWPSAAITIMSALAASIAASLCIEAKVRNSKLQGLQMTRPFVPHLSAIRSSTVRVRTAAREFSQRRITFMSTAGSNSGIPGWFNSTFTGKL
jgi:hypothetical protein